MDRRSQGVTGRRAYRGHEKTGGVMDRITISIVSICVDICTCVYKST